MQLTGITVCVDYADYLAITLPRNRKHFQRYIIVTSVADEATKRLADKHECDLYSTNDFYANGAQFNKYLPLETAIDLWLCFPESNRTEWLAILDADVIWPSDPNFSNFHPRFLHTPIRRMCYHPELGIPDESEWGSLPANEREEFAGYTQIFNVNADVLGPRPWHETNWKHAGGGDSFFAHKFSKPGWIKRPNWEVLHLGLDGKNWCGRTTNQLDGTEIDPRLAAERADVLREYMAVRAKSKSFSHEKISLETAPNPSLNVLGSLRQP